MSGKNSSNHENSDKIHSEVEVSAYKKYLEKEIIKETYLKENFNSERISFLIDELNTIDPPMDIDVRESLNKFHQTHISKINEGNKKHIRSRALVSLVAVIVLLSLSSVAVIGYKFNMFDMFITSNDMEKKVQYHNNDDIPEELHEASEIINVQSVDAALAHIPFMPVLPSYLPNGYSIKNIQINKTSEDFIDLRIDYINQNSNVDLNYSVLYTNHEGYEEMSRQYENDYNLTEVVKILGHDCVIFSDNYNNNCSFVFDKAVYSITVSKNVSLSEFKKILESIK